MSYAKIFLKDFNIATDGNQSEAINNGNKWQQAYQAGEQYSKTDYVWPDGTIYVADVHTPETVYWDDAAIKIRRNNVRFFAENRLRTTIILPDYDGGSVIEVGRDSSPAYGVSNIPVSGFEIDGIILDNNNQNQNIPNFNDGSWSCLVISDNCTDTVARFVKFLNGVRYGARIGTSGVTNTLIEYFECKGSFSDGIDVKSKDGTNYGNFIRYGFVTDWGTNTGGVSAAYDIRSGATVENCIAYGGGTGPNDRDMFRTQVDIDEATNGDEIKHPPVLINTKAIGIDPNAFFTVGYRISGRRTKIIGASSYKNARGIWLTANKAFINGLDVNFPKDGFVGGNSSGCKINSLTVVDANRYGMSLENNFVNNEFMLTDINSQNVGILLASGVISNKLLYGTTSGSVSSLKDPFSVLAQNKVVCHEFA